MKILDFGLAASVEDPSSPDESRAVLGTPAYMAPEQIRGDHLDGRCDLFGLGCILYQLCTGAVPFQRDPEQLRTRKIDDASPRPIGEINCRVPPDLVTLISKLLAIQPDGRPDSAKVVERELGRTEQALTTPRRFWLTWAAAIACLPLAWFALWLLGRDPLAFLYTPSVLPESEQTLPPGPPDEMWRSYVAQLPGQRRVAAVLAKLIELNPGFDLAQANLEFRGGGPAELSMQSDHLTDIRPVRALPDLKVFKCVGSKPGAGRLTDLSPLRGLQLDSLIVWYNPGLTDFSPAREMKLSYLDANGTGLSSLDGLDGSRMVMLHIANTGVRDLTAVKHMPKLFSFSCLNCAVESLEPLIGSNIEELYVYYRPDRDEVVLRKMPKLRLVNYMPIKNFWKLVGTQAPP